MFPWELEAHWGMQCSYTQYQFKQQARNSLLVKNGYREESQTTYSNWPGTFDWETALQPKLSSQLPPVTALVLDEVLKGEGSNSTRCI